MPSAASRTSLCFRLGNDVCHVAISRVERVLPWARLDPPAPGSPDALVGWLSFHGDSVPIIDLGKWVLQQPLPPLFSTRIMLLRASSGGRRIGLLVGQLTDTIDNTESAASRKFDPDQVLLSLLPLLPARSA